MTWPRRYNLVTAIYLNARGCAFVVFEGPLAPLDWSIVEVRGEEKRDRIVVRISSLLTRYRPEVVVLQDMSQTGTQRPHRIQRLNDAIAELARAYTLTVAVFSREEVRRQFAYLGSVTKDTIALAIAKRIPA